MIDIETIFRSINGAKIQRMKLGKKLLATPCYFPAISTTKASIPSEYLLQAVVSSSFPRVLVTCYDFYKLNLKSRNKRFAQISEYFRNGGIVMVDSGIFESYWNTDRSWSFKKFASTLSQIDSELYFSFDLLPDNTIPLERFIRITKDRIRRSCSLESRSTCIPIVHGAGSKESIQNAERILSILPASTKMVAVPERDCGKTLSERALTVSRISQLISKTESVRSLHILGCGNPISMAVYSYCGADTFDSLDWSMQIIERDELRILDFSQLELIGCSCEVCKNKRIRDPTNKALLHNLLFYQDYGLKLQNMIKKGTIKDFVLEFVGKEFIDEISRNS